MHILITHSLPSGQISIFIFLYLLLRPSRQEFGKLIFTYKGYVIFINIKYKIDVKKQTITKK